MLYADRIDFKDAEKTVEEVGICVLNNLKERTGWLYPLREKSNEEVFGYVWTYRQKCPYCGKKFILSKRPWLSKKKGRRIAFVSEVLEEGESETLVVKELEENEMPFSSPWEKRTGILQCPKCGEIVTSVEVLGCEDVMTACIKTKAESGKEFVNADQKSAIPSNKEIDAAEADILKKIGTKLPESELPVWSGIDYAETDQLLSGPANLWDKLKRIIKGIRSFENCRDRTFAVPKAGYRL